MSMSKEENITQIIDGIYISTFKPKKEETIFVTIDIDKVDLDIAQTIFKVIAEMFPENNTILKTDGITIESILEDDLK